jgi:hypothetical protein
MNTGGIAGADAFAVTIGTGHDKRPSRDAEANGLWVLQHPRRPSVGPLLVQAAYPAPHKASTWEASA